MKKHDYYTVCLNEQLGTFGLSVKEIDEFNKNINTLSKLYQTGFFDIPEDKGVYIVFRPENFEINFSGNTTAITEYRGKSMLYDSIDLHTKYEKSDKIILYIGKASGEKNKLKSRIKQLVLYGCKKYNNHRGGRAIWQIENNKDLIIGYCRCNNPKEKEKELLKKYQEIYEVFPVANWKY